MLSLSVKKLHHQVRSCTHAGPGSRIDCGVEVNSWTVPVNGQRDIIENFSVGHLLHPRDWLPNSEAKKPLVPSTPKRSSIPPYPRESHGSWVEAGMFSSRPPHLDPRNHNIRIYVVSNLTCCVTCSGHPGARCYRQLRRLCDRDSEHKV